MPKTTVFLFPPENTVLTGDILLVDKFMQKFKKMIGYILPEKGKILLKFEHSS